MFLIDVKINKKFSWEETIHLLNNRNSFYQIAVFNSLYEYFLNIVIAVLTNKNVTLIDYTFTQEEIERLLGEDIRVLNQKETVQIPHINDKEDLIERLRNEKKWSITLYTSGTTGIPKKVIHTKETISKGIVVSERHCNDIWGFAYNITHIAGLQVFFQALFNGNTLINLFNVVRESIIESINKYKITHISATPSFYRMLQPIEHGAFPGIRRVTIGGERSDKNLLESLSKSFVNAKIKNTYATTEFGTILITEDGEKFSIPEKYKDRVKIVDDEIVVHKSLLGKIDRELHDWYHTGDKVEIIQNDPIIFKILGRSSDFVNVGGYKVNLQEVEEVMREIDGIKDIKVYAKNNSVLGKIVCADVVSQDENCNELEIRKILSDKLQDYKIPRVIRFVQNLEITRTGKLKSYL